MAAWRAPGGDATLMCPPGPRVRSTFPRLALVTGMSCGCSTCYTSTWEMEQKEMPVTALPPPRVPLRPPVSLSIPIWKMGPRHLLTEAKIPGVKAAWASSTAQGQTDRQTEVPSRSTWRSPRKHRAGPGRFRESSGSQRPFLDSLSKVPPPREKQGYH